MAPELKPFSCRSDKNERVYIYWQGKQVKVLKGKSAARFLLRIAEKNDKEIQLEMARVTGNFKRGNEKDVGYN